MPYTAKTVKLKYLMNTRLTAWSNFQKKQSNFLKMT